VCFTEPASSQTRNPWGCTGLQICTEWFLLTFLIPLQPHIPFLPRLTQRKIPHPRGMLSLSPPTCSSMCNVLGTDLTQQKSQGSTHPREPEGSNVESGETETRGKPRFPIDHPFLKGHSHSEKEAQQISADVSISILPALKP
jgi:hypothetical protein